jgi:hypothetical protein
MFLSDRIVPRFRNKFSVSLEYFHAIPEPMPAFRATGNLGPGDAGGQVVEDTKIQGLPVGLQIISRRHVDAAVLAAAVVFETACTVSAPPTSEGLLVRTQLRSPGGLHVSAGSMFTFGRGLRARVSAETYSANAWRNCSGRSAVWAGTA